MQRHVTTTIMKEGIQILTRKNRIEDAYIRAPRSFVQYATPAGVALRPRRFYDQTYVLVSRERPSECFDGPDRILTLEGAMEVEDKKEEEGVGSEAQTLSIEAGTKAWFGLNSVRYVHDGNGRDAGQRLGDEAAGCPYLLKISELGHPLLWKMAQLPIPDSDIVPPAKVAVTSLRGEKRKDVAV